MMTTITKRVGQGGNILFLILLAVVLFAALAYAVTSSIRGGGKDSGSEKAELYAAQIIQSVTLMASTINRMQMSENYQQVYFYDTPLNTSGTVYWGNNVTTTGKTVGLFNATNGGIPSYPLPPEGAFVSNSANASYTGIQIRTVMDSNQNHMGTSAPDVSIMVGGLTLAVCKAINQKLGVNITNYTTTVDQPGIGGSSYTSWSIRNNGTKLFTADNTVSGNPVLPFSQGCFPSGAGPDFRYWDVIEIR